MPIRIIHLDDYRLYLEGVKNAIIPKEPDFSFNGFTDHHGKPLASFEVYAGDDLIPYAKFGYFIKMGSDGETKDIYVVEG